MFATLSKFNLEIQRKPNDWQFLRVLFLYEWLYHSDYLGSKTLDEDSLEMFDSVVKDPNLSAVCKSKAKKLKLLYKSETVPTEPLAKEGTKEEPKENIC